MKRIFLSLAIAFTTLFAYAQNQNQPAGIRMELTEVDDNDNEFSIFTYKDDDGTYGYYLSVSHAINILEIFTDDSNASFSHFDETLLCLGANADEARTTLAKLLLLLDEPAGTITQLPSRLSTGADRLGAPGTVNVAVVKPLILGKRLRFQFFTGNHSAEATLTRPTLKTLISSFNFALKLHPEQ